MTALFMETIEMLSKDFLFRLLTLALFLLLPVREWIFSPFFFHCKTTAIFLRNYRNYYYRTITTL